MIYLFKTYDLAGFKDFNLFSAMKQIGEETGKWDAFSDMESLEGLIIDDYNEVGDYSEAISADNYLIIVDLDNQTILKKIYTLRLESKVIGSDEEIQKLIDEEARAEEEWLKECEKLAKETNAP